MFDVTQHELRLKELNERFLEGKMSRQDVANEISEILGDTAEQKEELLLEAQISERISPKMRERLSPEAYFALREKIREKILGAGEESDKAARLEEARVTGSTCIYCNSSKVVSYGEKWHCLKCNRFFRKH